MRITRNMLLKLANDSVEKFVHEDRSIMAVYLQGSLLGDHPLMGNTADIDLFIIHSDEMPVEREIIRISDEVHLDISHHTHNLYRQPRELRADPWLGPTIYGCKILHDPQHFIDFVQASVRGQFYTPSTVINRVKQPAEHAREMWEELYNQRQAPDPHIAALYLSALNHAANALAGLNGRSLTERRFLIDLHGVVDALHKPGLYAGFLGLLGAPSIEKDLISSWLPHWTAAYDTLPANGSPVRLQPARHLYYERAMEEILNGVTPMDMLWPLWHTWTDMMPVIPADNTHHSAWQSAGEQLGLLGNGFSRKVEALDAYLDQVEELLETWAHENGV